MTTVMEKLEEQTVTAPVRQRGIKYDYEILEGLSRRYAGEIKALPSGNQYVDWHSKVRIANEIFGPLGWSSTNVSPPTIIDGIGFMACKRVTVRYRDSETNEILEMHHEATGFNSINPNMKPEQALDTASKGADSDALSKVFANFGDAFALFLWSGTRAPVQAATNTRAASPQGQAVQRATAPVRATSTGSLATEGQQTMMVKLLVPRATAATVSKSLAMSADRDPNGGDLIGQLLSAKTAAGRGYSARDAREVIESNGVTWVEDGRTDDMLDSYSEDEYPE